MGVGLKTGPRPPPLVGLPLWAKLAVAVVVVAVVVAAATVLDPSQAKPPWLGSWIRLSGWLYLGIVVLLCIRWAVRAVRRSRSTP